MSLFRIFDIAGSAMSAQSVRLNATASNLANAESVSSSAETTYRARRPVFASALADVMQGEKEVLLGLRSREYWKAKLLYCVSLIRRIRWLTRMDLFTARMSIR